MELLDEFLLDTAALCDIGHIKQHYYRSHPHINPSGIVPLGPELALDATHDRGRFAGELFATPT